MLSHKINFTKMTQELASNDKWEIVGNNKWKWPGFPPAASLLLRLESIQQRSNLQIAFEFIQLNRFARCKFQLNLPARNQIKIVV